MKTELLVAFKYIIVATRARIDMRVLVTGISGAMDWHITCGCMKDGVIYIQGRIFASTPYIRLNVAG